MDHDFILLDRTGSMRENNKIVEAVAAVNTYVEKLATDKVDTGVTLAIFDKHQGKNTFDVIRDRIIPSTWKSVTQAEVTPRGFTPLSDSIGRLVELAQMGNYNKVAIIIVTDGEENASDKLTVDQAKALLDECRARGWQVIFLGADFDNTAQAASYGTRSAQTLGSVAPEKMQASATMTAAKRGLYGSGAAADMSYTDAEKESLKRTP